jgi:phosphoglycolate phosphatase-like HAD superfamily hydrolase
MEHSYMVGDRASDIELGKNVGVKTVLLESGYGSQRLEGSVTPDYILRDLREFIEIL